MNINKNNFRGWTWNDRKNRKKIELTVGLPILKGEEIVWLALESLKNQINTDEFAWELIVIEEDGLSSNQVKEYCGKMPGCSKVTFVNASQDMGYYPKELMVGRKSNITLLEKWITMTKMADKNSRILVKHAADCYSSLNRLNIHYQNFKNDDCYYSTQPKGNFYCPKLDKYFLYDGKKIEPYNWYKKALSFINNSTLQNSIMENADWNSLIKFNKNTKIRTAHLNMALDINIVKKITIPKVPIFKGIDSFLISCILLIANKDLGKKKIIYTDDEIDKDNWKYSLDTDGYNSISLSRKTYYEKVSKFGHCIPVDNGNVQLNVPEYIMDKLKLNVLKLNVLKNSNNGFEGRFYIYKYDKNTVYKKIKYETRSQKILANKIKKKFLNYKNIIENIHKVNFLPSIKGYDVENDGSYKCKFINGYRLDRIENLELETKEIYKIKIEILKLKSILNENVNKLSGDWALHNLIYSINDNKIYNVDLEGFFSYPSLPTWGNINLINKWLDNCIMKLNLKV